MGLAHVLSMSFIQPMFHLCRTQAAKVWGIVTMGQSVLSKISVPGKRVKVTRLAF